MSFQDFLSKHTQKPYIAGNLHTQPQERANIYAHLPPDNQQLPEQPQDQPGSDVPNGVSQIMSGIMNGIDRFVPAIEHFTGLTRREICLNLLKTGFKGGNISTLLDGLIGNKPAPEPKFIRYVKIGAVWIPIAVFLMGLSLIGVFIVFKGAMILLGTL